jgi:hypothetical protein
MIALVMVVPFSTDDLDGQNITFAKAGECFGPPLVVRAWCVPRAWV